MKKNQIRETLFWEFSSKVFPEQQTNPQDHPILPDRSDNIDLHKSESLDEFHFLIRLSLSSKVNREIRNIEYDIRIRKSNDPYVANVWDRQYRI